MIKIEKDIYAERVRKKHLESIYDLVMKNQEHLSKFLEWAIDYSMEKLESRYVDWRKMDKTFVIFYKGKIGGLFEFFQPTLEKYEKDYLEIGYWLDKDICGNGIMTKTCRFLVEKESKEGKYRNYLIQMLKDNKKSMNIAKRLEFDLDTENEEKYMFVRRF